MAARKTVSTIIPAYNAESVISHALHSALAQDVKQEIIVVDDGSTDDTAAVVRRYGEKVKLIQQPNRGVSAARNRGIAEATGDIVAFLDADDVWLADKLAKQLALFEADSGIGTVICDESHVTLDGRIVRKSYLETRDFAAELPTTPNRLSRPVTWLVKQPFFPTSSVATKASVLRQAGSFDENLSIVEDRDMWLRLALNAPIGLVPEVLVNYLTGQNESLSSSTTDTAWANALSIVISRNLNELSQAVTTEGANSDLLLSEVFERIGQTLWYGKCYGEAGEAFGRAAAHGSRKSRWKWLACKTRLAPLLVGIKAKIKVDLRHSAN